MCRNEFFYLEATLLLFLRNKTRKLFHFLKLLYQISCENKLFIYLKRIIKWFSGLTWNTNTKTRCKWNVQFLQSSYADYIYSFAVKNVQGLHKGEGAYLNACFWVRFVFKLDNWKQKEITDQLVLRFQMSLELLNW